MFTDRGSVAIPLILVAGWINLKIFLFCPLTIYITNAAEMRVAFLTLIALYFMPFLASMAILVGLGLALPRGPGQCYVAVLAAIGALLWLQSDVLLWGYGPLDGTFIDWPREAWKGYVDTQYGWRSSWLPSGGGGGSSRWFSHSACFCSRSRQGRCG